MGEMTLEQQEGHLDPWTGHLDPPHELPLTCRGPDCLFVHVDGSDLLCDLVRRIRSVGVYRVQVTGPLAPIALTWVLNLKNSLPALL